MRFSAESVFFFLSRCNTHAFTIEGASPQTWKTLLLYLDIDSIQGHFQRHNYKLQITKTKFHPSKISNYLMMILHNLQQVTKLRPNLLGLFVSFYWFHWRRQWHPTPVLLPRKSHVQRRLVGCSPWGCEESDTTERLHFHFSLSCIGEGSGRPLQRSCLENPRDGGTSWAAVYGLAQSQT